jgi:hypothetical protein
MNFFKSHPKTNALIGALVFGISFVVYFLTMSPSICLWDCGEYLAATASLGIPHPPGTPLLVMLGRVWVVLFSFLHDVGYRFNLLAVFSSSVVVLFVYLIIIRSLIMVWGEPDALWKRLCLYCGGFTGSLFCAFAATFWFAALEASQQSNITNFTTVLTIWLTLVWAQSKSENRDRLLLLIGYVTVLGTGIRMISILTLPAIFAFVALVDKEKRRDWRLWMAVVTLCLIMYNLSWFLWAAPAVTVLSLVMMSLSPRQRASWRFCFFFVLLAILGFSTVVFLPIRSSLNPMMDEGHPVTWKAFKEVLDRKQYGNESMVSRSLWRRGSFGHQFGIDGHMGYGGFHMLQFFHFDTKDQEKNFVDGSASGWGKLLVYLLPTLFALFGWYLMAKKNKNVAALLIVITLLTTLGMVWYMNFADGHCCDNRTEFNRWVSAGSPGAMPVIYREVRVRDYFYSTGFLFFGMWIGLAAGLVLYRLFSSPGRQVRSLAAPLAFVLFLVSPLLPLSQNYRLRDRSGNVLPFDYAYNLLMSCARNAVLFTNGDNDTFPVWAIQEAYGIRRDVRLVNLSLVNTDWYIKELKKLEPKVPISYTDGQIDALQPEYNPFESAMGVELTSKKLRGVIPGRKDLQVLRVQDKMILNVIDATDFSKPVYFAGSVSNDNFMGLDPYLKMEGMVWRLMPERVPESERVDADRIGMLLDSVYRVHPLPRHKIDKDEPYEGIINDYTICFLYFAMTLQERMTALDSEIKSLEKTAAAPGARQKTARAADSTALAQKRIRFAADFDRVLQKLDRCVSLMPWNMQPIHYRHEFLLKFSQPKMAEARARKLLSLDPADTQLRRLLAQALDAQGKRKEAMELLRRG